MDVRTSGEKRKNSSPLGCVQLDFLLPGLLLLGVVRSDRWVNLAATLTQQAW